jgi:predicted TIM-barrel fold metal-dependent hydrolase
MAVRIVVIEIVREPPLVRHELLPIVFESNFPPDGVSSSYPVLWNAFKRLAAGYSPEDKAKLFSGTAKRVYRLA